MGFSLKRGSNGSLKRGRADLTVLFETNRSLFVGPVFTEKYFK
jgi:hypothetical protein